MMFARSVASIDDVMMISPINPIKGNVLAVELAAEPIANRSEALATIGSTAAALDPLDTPSKYLVLRFAPLSNSALTILSRDGRVRSDHRLFYPAHSGLG